MSSDAPIRIEDEGNVLHLAVRELLLELEPTAIAPAAVSEHPERRIMGPEPCTVVLFEIAESVE